MLGPNTLIFLFSKKSEIQVAHHFRISGKSSNSGLGIQISESLESQIRGGSFLERKTQESRLVFRYLDFLIFKSRTGTLKEKIQNRSARIGVIGLGYVGLPLAIEFGKKYKTIGFDINKKRVEALKLGIDITQEVENDGFRDAKKLSFTNKAINIARCNYFIIPRSFKSLSILST